MMIHRELNDISLAGPCGIYESLNKRHIHDYNVNLIDNLLRIKETGIDQWLKKQADKWVSPKCAGTMCVMDSECYDCEHIYGHKID